ncbi:phosphoribosylglycinamide formyltransferase [Oscillatoria sp. FACHB-1406]|uniref:phosphoribosylglycinamide formyltransferase n=1 Tax=Oscillatoria sp. FACHB-1406 TaxID=2692846 RepID=UPI001682D8AF|nr:phosphoribosylglycinamide formyltransferase [Oscillatoria sp. FACHB-1406]MBD2578361.1 phosphoribosylglycinamide formyltransferase [Oscillatoria sp. FACHB-1406]
MTANPESPALISPSITLKELPQTQTLKLGVLASGSGSNFEAIARSIQNGELNAKIQVLIYNNPSAKAAERAKQFGIPAVLLNHRNYKKREDLDRAIIQTLAEYGADWAILAGWMRIVTPVLIDAFPDRLLNIHPSILPSFRGLHAIEQAIAARVKVAGCTVHYVTPEVDSGAIIIQAVVPVLEGDTAETLHARVQVQEHRIFPLAIALAAQRSPS